MGCSTTLVGCLPSYNHIGAAAPALLVFLRVCMGLALGAEYTTGAMRERQGRAAGEEHAATTASAILPSPGLAALSGVEGRRESTMQ